MVTGDKCLHQLGERGKGFSGSVDQAIPQNPAALSGRVLFEVHGLGLPRDQGVQAIGWDYRPAANANGLETACGDMGVNSRPAQAGGSYCLLNGIGDFRGIVFDGLH
jgi:hypothetical protein